jgi:hypothetical protein
VVIAIDQAVTLVESDAATQRRIAAYDDRSVTVITGLDGMAVVRAKISATDGAATDAQLPAMAKAVTSRRYEARCRELRRPRYTARARRPACLRP